MTRRQSPPQPSLLDSPDRESTLTNSSGARPQITLFSIPKPHEGQIAAIQSNAIRSWTRLRPDVEIILFGDASSLQTVADECGAVVLPIRVNDHGTPLLSDAFAQAHRTAQGEYLLYANSDILFDTDLLDAARRLAETTLTSFVAMGRRIELSVDEEISSLDSQRWMALFDSARQSGRLSSIVCKDYFLFTRNLFNDIPDLLVGRGNWDNWIIHRAKQESVPVIELTETVTVIHQEHGHGHVRGGRMAAYISGQEAKENQRLCGGRNLVSGSTATWRLSANGLQRNRFPTWTFVRDLPRFLTLLRNLMFLRYFFALSTFFA